ncbi:MAG TPA: hypothetical protein VFT49_03305 [Candidatus Saccharimonadales bacterium]|nr:hypothetical protein [Candidatus Saccharimonadales bacterium]
MGKIIVRKESEDHWRAFIKEGKKIIVVDGIYDSDVDAAHAALGVNE